MRPFPQFQNIDTRRYDGSSSFDSAQFRVTKRFTGGYMADAAYTWSDFKEQVTRLNDTDPDYEERFNDTHLPHRLVVSGIWELPFGHGRRWGSDSNAVVNGLIGNWSVSFIYNWQSGRPNMTMGNVYYNGDITQLKAKYTKDPTVPVFDTSGFYFHDAAVQTNGVDDPAKQRADQRIQLASNIRTIPTRWDGLRGQEYVNWDMSFVKGARVRPGHGPVPHRALQRLQQRVLQHPEPDPEQRRLRQGVEPEQPAAQYSDWDEDGFLAVHGSRFRVQGSGFTVQRSEFIVRGSPGSGAVGSWAILRRPSQTFDNQVPNPEP